MFQIRHASNTRVACENGICFAKCSITCLHGVDTYTHTHAHKNAYANISRPVDVLNSHPPYLTASSFPNADADKTTTRNSPAKLKCSREHETHVSKRRHVCDWRCKHIVLFYVHIAEYLCDARLQCLAATDYFVPRFPRAFPCHGDVGLWCHRRRPRSLRVTSYIFVLCSNSSVFL